MDKSKVDFKCVFFSLYDFNTPSPIILSHLNLLLCLGLSATNPIFLQCDYIRTAENC